MGIVLDGSVYFGHTLGPCAHDHGQEENEAAHAAGPWYGHVHEVMGPALATTGIGVIARATGPIDRRDVMAATAGLLFIDTIMACVIEPEWAEAIFRQFIEPASPHIEERVRMITRLFPVAITNPEDAPDSPDSDTLQSGATPTENP